LNVQECSLKINKDLKNTLNDFLKFPLSEAIAGRRARRFCLGAEIPDGVLSFKSKHDPLSLSEIEQLLLLSYMGGVTGWHFAIMRHERYAPKLSNYSASPVGRTYPSAAGFITSELFFTDDNGTYIFPTRDFHPQIEIHDGKVDLSIAYPILDAVLVIPAVSVLWVVRTEQPLYTHWMLLSLFMLFFVVADSGFGYAAVSDIDIIQKEGWLWDIFYNAGYISIAAALFWHNYSYLMKNENKKAAERNH
jgi:hypothetical protein